MLAVVSLWVVLSEGIEVREPDPCAEADAMKSLVRRHRPVPVVVEDPPFPVRSLGEQHGAMAQRVPLGEVVHRHVYEQPPVVAPVPAPESRRVEPWLALVYAMIALLAICGTLFLFVVPAPWLADGASRSGPSVHRSHLFSHPDLVGPHR